MATTTAIEYSVKRITLHIPKPYPEVLARLQSSIVAKPGQAMQTLLSASNRQEFDNHTNDFLGPHSFMQFVTMEHGNWIGFYGVHMGKALTRIIFGNPQIAITMIQHDLKAGLFAPIEALLVDLGEGLGTDVVYIVPSSLIAGGDPANKPLREAAQVLDEKLENLWKFVAET